MKNSSRYDNNGIQIEIDKIKRREFYQDKNYDKEEENSTSNYSANYHSYKNNSYGFKNKDYKNRLFKNKNNFQLKSNNSSSVQNKFDIEKKLSLLKLMMIREKITI